jgi:hypothetical protein
VLEFMFRSVTLSASVHPRAGPGGKHCADAVTRGRPAVVFQAKENLVNDVKQCPTVTRKGCSKVQTCRLPPILQ